MPFQDIHVMLKIEMDNRVGLRLHFFDISSEKKMYHRSKSADGLKNNDDTRD